MFLIKDEKLISDDYVKNGFVIRKINNIKYLNKISEIIKKFIFSYLKKNKIKYQDNDILNNIHKYIKKDDLNNFRLFVINKMYKVPEFREIYFKISKEYIDNIIGNEIAMQQRVNLSIQMPKDDSSLLPIHADTWSGNSPYEVVVWLPLVDCYKTKSMFLLPPKYEKKLNLEIKNNKFKNSEDLYGFVKKNLIWFNIKYGELLIFNQSLPHGNRINLVNETRWSMNCRFKGLFTPYGDKKIGEFFEPITMKPATIAAMTKKE